MRGKGGKGRAGGPAAAVMLTFVVGIGAPGACRAAKERLPLPGKVYTWSFQTDTLGQKPAHSVAFGGNWQVVEDSTNATVNDSTARAAPAPRLLFQAESDDGISFHYLN